MQAGEIYKTYSWGDVEVIEAPTEKSVMVRFKDSGNVDYYSAAEIRRGAIKDRRAAYEATKSRTTHGTPPGGGLVGQTFESSHSGPFIVEEYINARDIVVRFTDTGYTTRTTKATLLGRDRPYIRDRSLGKGANLVGCEYESANCGRFVVWQYKSAQDVLVMFLETGGIVRTTKANIVSRERPYIRDPLAYTIQGRGRIGVGPYSKQTHSEAYRHWLRVLRDGFHLGPNGELVAEYFGRRVDDSWRDFQIFAAMYEAYVIENKKVL